MAKVLTQICDAIIWIEDDQTKVKCKRCFDLGFIVDQTQPLEITAKHCYCSIFTDEEKRVFKNARFDE